MTAQEKASATSKALRKAYESGDTLQSLAYQHGLALQRVRRLVVEAGGAIRKAGNPAGRMYPRLLTQRQRWIEWRASGLTLAEIARREGLSITTVGAYLRRMRERGA